MDSNPGNSENLKLLDFDLDLEMPDVNELPSLMEEDRNEEELRTIYKYLNEEVDTPPSSELDFEALGYDMTIFEEPSGFSMEEIPMKNSVTQIDWNESMGLGTREIDDRRDPIPIESEVQKADHPSSSELGVNHEFDLKGQLNQKEDESWLYKAGPSGLNCSGVRGSWRRPALRPTANRRSKRERHRRDLVTKAKALKRTLDGPEHLQRIKEKQQRLENLKSSMCDLTPEKRTVEMSKLMKDIHEEIRIFESIQSKTLKTDKKN